MGFYPTFIPYLLISSSVPDITTRLTIGKHTGKAQWCKKQGMDLHKKFEAQNIIKIGPEIIALF